MLAPVGLLELNENGLYCAAGDFYVDPWRGVPLALITHAHSDHARPGSQAYLCAEPGRAVLQVRLGKSVSLTGLQYGEVRTLGDVRVSFHPAGHVLGSAQIRLEHRGEVWVVTGDYKTATDPTCTAFEPVRCHTLITESTFGLPIYRWPGADGEFERIRRWWQANAEAARTSVLRAYSLGKAQRLLAGLDPATGPLLVHAAVASFLPAYADAGVRLPPVELTTPERVIAARGRALVVAPPGTDAATWIRPSEDYEEAVASGWMQVRGARRWRQVARGFVLSDHADWPGLTSAIRATGAEQVWVTHGYASALARWLTEQGCEARVLRTRFGGDEEDPPPAAQPEETQPAPEASDAEEGLA